MKIVYQGEPGANSEISCLEMFPEAKAEGCPTFEDCFEAMAAGQADLAMIPIENSLAGRVADIHHLLPDSNLHIVGEHFLPIRFCLAAPRGATAAGLRTAESHLHALGQCRQIMRELDLKPVEAGDTAGAARLVAEAGDLGRGALCTERAAEIYDLEILARNVEDAEHNATRFVVLSQVKQWAPADTETITSFMFRVRNIPAALYKALGGFATNGVNMTKLESYQLDGTFLASQFYVDVEGHPDQRPVALAFEELSFFTGDVRIFGVYPRHRYRDHAASRGD